MFEDFSAGEDLIALHIPARDGGSTNFSDCVALRETTECGTTIIMKRWQALVLEGAGSAFPDDAFVIVLFRLTAA